MKKQKIIAFNTRLFDKFDYTIGYLEKYESKNCYKKYFINNEWYTYKIRWTKKNEEIFKYLIQIPSQLILEIPIPPRFIGKYILPFFKWFKKMFYLDFGIVYENEESYGKLYYNADLRSFSGYIDNIEDIIEYDEDLDENSSCDDFYKKVKITGDHMKIILKSKYYAPGFEKNFLNLLLTATKIEEV